MREISCPHCSKAFKIDEAGYADILKQVRDGEFEEQLHERLELAERDKLNAVQLAETKTAADRDANYSRAQGQTRFGRGGAEACRHGSAERSGEAARRARRRTRKKRGMLPRLAETRMAADKDAVIQELKAKLDSREVEQKLAVAEALREVEKQARRPPRQ